MRRTLSIVVALVASLFLLAGTGSAREKSWSEGLSPYTAGERFEDLPLVAVLHRDDTARYVSFVYGDCPASADTGCAPPAEVQVWPACERTLDSYGDVEPQAERIAVRGVPAVLFDEGTRLELETGRSTIVVFAATRARALRVAAALRALDGSVGPGRPLPAPVRSVEGVAMDC